MAEKIRVLLIVEQANPEWVSVPLVGWMQIKALQKVADIHVVTHIRNRPAIERSGFPLQQITFIAPGGIQKLLDWISSKVLGQKGGWTTYNILKVPMYYVFEWKTWKHFLPDFERKRFDVVHRITPLSPAIPSFIAHKLNRLGLPFVIGPINGGLKWPDGFRHLQYEEREWLNGLRWMKDFLPFMSSTWRHAGAILVGSLAAYEDMKATLRNKCFYVPENGIRPEDYQEQAAATSAWPIRVAFVGRLVPLKCADVLIRAASPLITQGRLELHIYGDGPERQKLEGLAQELTAGKGIVFHGWVPHANLRKELLKNSVFAFPSIKEFGGGALIEAMALGLAPIVANYGGIAEVVTPECGFRIPLTSAEVLTAAMKKALETLVEQPERISSLGQKARERILSEYTWDRKAQRYLEIYAWLGRSQRQRPEQAFPIVRQENETFGDDTPKKVS